MAQDVISVKMPDGSVKTFPASMPIEQIQAEVDKLLTKPTSQPGLASLTPQSTGGDIGSIAPRDFVSGLIKAGTAATGLIPGARLPAMALRTALGAGGDAAAAAVKGEGALNPVDAAVLGGGINIGGETLSKAIPAVTTPLSFIFGGGLQGFRNIPDGAAAAFNREAERRMIPIAVGQGKRTQKAKQFAAKELEATERANPNRVQLSGFQNANADYHAKSINTLDGLAQRETIDSIDQRFIESQALLRNGLDDASFRQIVSQVHNNPQYRQAAIQHFGRPPTEAETKSLLLSDLIDNTSLSARDTGELMRGVREQGSDVVRARMNREFVPPGEQVRGQVAANNAKNIQDKYKSIDRDTRTPYQKITSIDDGPDMARANARFSDLAVMKAANEAIRRDLSMVGIRGAIGSGAGPLIGLSRGLAGLIGSVADPSLVSGLGYLLGFGARATPSGIRTVDAAQDMTPKKRKPEGPK